MTSLSTLTLSANNGAADQSRPYGLLFSGAPNAGGCAVTIPSVTRFGLAQNGSSGAVTLTTGAGGSATNLVLAANGPWTPYYCDGTNVSNWLTPSLSGLIPPRGFVAFTTAGNTTWNPPAQVQFVTFTLVGAGNAGGAGGGGAGGGGGGGAWFQLGLPTSSTETFTATNYLGAAILQSSVGDFYVAADPGATGANGGVGTAGVGGSGGTLTTTLGSIRAGADYYGTAGQNGMNGQIVSSSLYMGGAGGATGAGASGAPYFFGPPGNVAPATPGITYGCGAAGGVGNGSGGAAYPYGASSSIILAQW